MLKVIPFEQCYEHKDLMDHMFFMRHKLFSGQRPKPAISLYQSEKKDQFDADGTQYLLALGLDGELEGSVRLIPSKKPHLLRTIYPELCLDNEVPICDTVWEMSRLFVSSKSRYTQSGVLLQGLLFCGILAYALENDITAITGVSDHYFLSKLLPMNLDLKSLGISKPIENDDLVAFQITIDKEALCIAQSYFKVPDEELFVIESKKLSEAQTEYDVDNQDEIYELGLGFKYGHQEHVEELRRLIPLLASHNPQIVEDAEGKLDILMAEVRAEIVTASGNLGTKGMLS